jgi:uncharacterized protein (TIGR02679 family)
VSELAVPDAAIVAHEVRAAEIRDVLATPGWQWLTEAVRTAWEADLSRRRVRIDVDRLTADQTTAMANFLHWPTHRQGVVTVDLGRLDARLRASGLAAGLATCLTVSRGPLADVAGDRRAAGAARRVAAETLWARAKEHPAIARHPTLVGWLDDERAAGRLPAEPATRARVLGEALDVLAVLPDEGTGLARVATGVLGYAHALNAGTVPAAVLRAAGWLAGEPATAPSSEMRRRLWASLGVATDMVSSTVLVLGVTLVGDSPLAVSLAAHAAAGVPMRVTLGQLVHHVERAELRGPRRVWACENPSVVEAAADRLGARCGPLVCTEGRPSVAACRLLAGLTRAGTELRYHGDFDWAGLDIAAGVFLLGGLPWRLTADEYRSGVAAARVALPQLAVRRSALGEWDHELVAEMEHCGRQLEEEHVIDTLLADMTQDSSS